MSESTASGFFRPWRVPDETADGTAGVDDAGNDDNDSVVSSTSDSTMSATTSIPAAVPPIPDDNDHLSDRRAAGVVTTSRRGAGVARGRTRRGSESSDDDVATSTTTSLQGEDVLGGVGNDSRVSLPRRSVNGPTSVAPTLWRDDSGEFNGARDVSPLEYLSTLAFPRPEDFVVPINGGGVYATPIPDLAVTSTTVPELYSVRTYHHHSSVYSGIHRGVGQPNVYPGILAPGLCDRSVEEAVRMVHRQDAAAKQIKKMRPKKFRCQYCDMAFSNNGQLKGHIRIHTGERPFKCDVDSCGKSFTRNEELTRHKRIHTGVRPHSCVVCGKRFGRKDHLKKHTRTHEMRDPYRVATAALSVFALGHPFQQATAMHIPDLPPYVYQV